MIRAAAGKAGRKKSFRSTAPAQTADCGRERLLTAGLFLFFFLPPLVFVPGYLEGRIYCTLFNLPKAVAILAGGFFLASFYLFHLSRSPAALTEIALFLRRNPGARLLLLLLLWIGLSLAGATVFEVAFLSWLTFLFLGFFWLVLAGLFLSSARRWAAVWGLTAGYAGFIFLGLMQKLNGSLPFMISISAHYPTSTFANRNIAAQFIVFGLPFLLFAADRTRRRCGNRLLTAGLAVVAVVALVLLFTESSKNAILALAVQVLYLPLAWYWFRTSNHENRCRFFKVVAGAVVGVVLVFSLALAVPGSRGKLMRSWRQFREQGVTGVLRARYLFWRNTLVMIGDHPLTGVGIGNFRVVYPLYCRSYAWDGVTGYRKRARKVHNDYLQLAAECGIPALVLFIFLFGRQFYLLRIPEAGDDDGEAGADEWRLPLGAALLAYAVVMCFSFPLQTAYGRMFFFFLLALGEARAWRASLK